MDKRQQGKDKNSIFKEILETINQHRKEEVVNEGQVYALLYMYWHAECSSQELHEDLSYVMDWEYIEDVIGLIYDCDPEGLEDDFQRGFLEYVREVSE